MSMMTQPVLVLNASYEPVNITGARRAIVLVLKGVAVIEESRDTRVHSDLYLPSVVRLQQYRRIPQRVQMLSRKNIYVRDSYTCQYCGRVFTARELTLDHVLPRSKGGASNWENLVAACQACNRTKNDRTPEQAGMKLLRMPKPVTIHSSRSMMRMMGHQEEAWKKYLFF